LTQRANQPGRRRITTAPGGGLKPRPGDVDHFTRVRTYKAPGGTILRSRSNFCSRLPAPGHAYGWPKRGTLACIDQTQLWRETISLLAGDHASPGTDSQNRAVLRAVRCAGIGGAIQRRVRRQGSGLFQELVYLPESDRYEESGKAVNGITLSGHASS